MSKVSKKITNWLYSVLQPQYTHPEIAYKDIYQFLQVYIDQGFRIRTAVYTSVHGGSELLVNLYGPLICGNNVFQVSIWIPLNYPLADTSGKASGYDANGVPITFAVPSKGQIIRPGNNVDSQGKVYHPFLVSWYNSTSTRQMMDQFNLLLLMECLKSTFERSSPIGLAPQTTGPTLPPKSPSKINSPQQARISTLSSGPPLPEKFAHSGNSSELIPQKYRGPPPLPTYTTQNQWVGIDSSQSQSAMIQSPGQSTLTRYLNTLDRATTVKGEVSRPRPSVETNQGETSVIEDLMDKVTLESKKENSDPRELQRIAQHINRYLNPGNPESVNNKIPRVRKTRNIAKALYSQLLHHKNQARANAENLDKHVQYLEDQVQTVRYSNQKLNDLTELNKKSSTEVVLSASENRKIALDDLVLPDLMLVRQLYDSVAEIRGYKDAIRLVGGTFKSEPELINNLTLESCIRSVRALSRELFWLEVTRDEIGRLMSLQL
ncbi:UEV-domain-containing protein [Metschnikowia bicuspidata var. bicuspidata NRRL YB-4993]|uniref:UEV-domain-containing protein n=1 Tax=Metschnikowia bicuspidata var. bicuspidata NRRL YB-4993 TaxID=869754 RepID=A0A1A0HK27_9ASCO|nr:UEV-domain-containing protein [Metschnikowia bicuspidata var. bicuspidata NRRL YB-4993]OBA24534.1 UEV-domain-containing protein [Metschnikowia bicuspidata var. bicuspidata NRRL YB-4993]